MPGTVRVGLVGRDVAWRVVTSELTGVSLQVPSNKAVSLSLIASTLAAAASDGFKAAGPLGTGAVSAGPRVGLGVDLAQPLRR